jgi:HD-GYP domain-containing protein (c-di-GMP phosphodiesterase class II)
MLLRRWLNNISICGATEKLRIKQAEEQVSALRSSVICAFNQLLDLKDLNTGVHSTRLAEWGMRVGQELGLGEEELQNLEVAALLHDLGKVGIPDAILRKPGRLDEEEYNLMKGIRNMAGPYCVWFRALRGARWTSCITMKALMGEDIQPV